MQDGLAITGSLGSEGPALCLCLNPQLTSKVSGETQEGGRSGPSAPRCHGVQLGDKCSITRTRLRVLQAPPFHIPPRSLSWNAS
eukprot:2392070-Amphidinium_carterae.1